MQIREADHNLRDEMDDIAKFGWLINIMPSKNYISEMPAVNKHYMLARIGNSPAISVIYIGDIF